MIRFATKTIGRLPLVIVTLWMLGLAMAAILETATTAAAADAAVAIDGIAFTPLALTIPVGTRVVWMNQQLGEPCTVTSDADLWDSGPLQVGATFSFTFTQAGTFPYHSTTGPDLRGVVTVIPAGATITSPAAIIPDGLPRAGGGGEAIRMGRSRGDFFASIVVATLMLLSINVFVSKRVQR